MLEEIRRGKLRVPKFQRPFVWRPEKMLELFVSIYKGYPIGSPLIWESADPVRSLDVVGPIAVPQAGVKPVSYILDGHQRLATLFGVLFLPEDYARTEKQQDWRWWIFFDPESKGFVHVPKGPPHDRYIPLRAMFNTRDFLEVARTIEQSCGDKASDYISEMEELSSKLTNYKLAVTRIIGGSLDQAVNIFSRLNTSGQSMMPDQMVSALTYDDAMGDKTLAGTIDDILESLQEFQFDTINRITVFRAIVAASGKSIHKSDWEALAEELKKTDLNEAAEKTKAALRSSALFLNVFLKVPMDRLLPYTHQILLLSEFFRMCPEPDSYQEDLLKKWFWSTSLSGWFAGNGGNTTQLNYGLGEMRELAGYQQTGFNGFKIMSVDDPARPFPNRFDLRAARIRALLLFMLLLEPLDPETGTPLQADQVFRGPGTSALPYVFHRAPGGLTSSPANRVFLRTIQGRPAKVQLLGVYDELRQKVLESHCISEEAFHALQNDDARCFIETRAKDLERSEREFMVSLGLTLPKETGYAEPDIDTGED
ncbi:MAG: DUF262 domain-containing protein [Desulfatibacillum sp.]|nr:DUF262 domain-containing protein [Desulfatibacillum sp.]